MCLGCVGAMWHLGVELRSSGSTARTLSCEVYCQALIVFNSVCVCMRAYVHVCIQVFVCTWCACVGERAHAFLSQSPKGLGLAQELISLAILSGERLRSTCVKSPSQCLDHRLMQALYPNFVQGLRIQTHFTNQAISPAHLTSFLPLHLLDIDCFVILSSDLLNNFSAHILKHKKI